MISERVVQFAKSKRAGRTFVTLRSCKMKLVFCVLFWSCLWATSNADCSNTTDVTQTVFLLCTPETGDVTHTIPHDASDLGNFNPSRRTFVMMHGFQEDGSDWPVGQGFNEAFNSAGS